MKLSGLPTHQSPLEKEPGFDIESRPTGLVSEFDFATLDHFVKHLENQTIVAHWLAIK